MRYLRGNIIKDYSEFETGFHVVTDKPIIERWQYGIEQPSVDYLINGRYAIYKGSIKVMKQNEVREPLDKGIINDFL